MGPDSCSHVLPRARRGAATVPLGRPTAARLPSLPPRRGIGAPGADEDDLPPLMLAVAGQGISVVRGMLEVFCDWAVTDPLFCRHIGFFRQPSDPVHCMLIARAFVVVSG